MSGLRYSSTSDPRDTAITCWVMAAFGAVASCGLGWVLGWPLILDLNDPDFNPVIILLGLALGITLWNAGKAWRWQRRSARFGAVRMELDGPVPASLGRALSGRLVLFRPITAPGGVRLVLTCHDVHETPDLNDQGASNRRNESFPVWSQDRQLPAPGPTDLSLPFRFDLPASVGPKPVPAMSRTKNPYVTFNLFVTLPGFRRAITPGTPPVARLWKLVATADTDGPPFKAEFIVPMRD